MRCHLRWPARHSAGAFTPGGIGPVLRPFEGEIRGSADPVARMIECAHGLKNFHRIVTFLVEFAGRQPGRKAVSCGLDMRLCTGQNTSQLRSW